jgi:hypothetical protein
MTETLVQPESNVMPVEVRRAVNLLWLSLLLASTAAIIEHWHRVSRNVGVTVFFYMVIYGFWALLIWQISQRRRWARITWLLLFACGALATAFHALAYLGGSKSVANPFNSPFSAVIVVVQIAIQFYAAVLLLPVRQGRGSFGNDS